MSYDDWKSTPPDDVDVDYLREQTRLHFDLDDDADVTEEMMVEFSEYREELKYIDAEEKFERRDKYDGDNHDTRI